MIPDEMIESIIGLDALERESGIDAPDRKLLQDIIFGTPDSLKDVCHYAYLFGIGDDVYRSKVIDRIDGNLKYNLKWIVRQYDNHMDDWLAGPESKSQNPTAAYLAFSNMRMGIDEIL